MFIPKLVIVIFPILIIIIFWKQISSQLRSITLRNSEGPFNRKLLFSFGTKKDAACLQSHNDKRALHGSPPLAWSDVLAQHAQIWADHLAATQTFVHEQGIDEGENLYWARASTARNCTDAVEYW